MARISFGSLTLPVLIVTLRLNRAVFGITYFHARELAAFIHATELAADYPDYSYCIG